MTRPGIEPKSHRVLANTLTIMPVIDKMCLYNFIYICIYIRFGIKEPKRVDRPLKTNKSTHPYLQSLATEFSLVVYSERLFFVLFFKLVSYLSEGHAIDRISIIWKSDLTDKMKRSFFQAAVVSILLCRCTTWTLTKRREKKLDVNYTRMLRAILNKSSRQQPTRHQLYGHLLPIMKTLQVRRIRHKGHCWRSRDELISDVLLWTPTYGRAKAGRPARTYIQQLCEDTGCSPEDPPEAMKDMEKSRERVRDIRASMTWWWWWHPMNRSCVPRCNSNHNIPPSV